MFHDDVIKWKHFPRHWPFVRWIHRSPVNSPHKGQWCGALMFSLICVWINDWVNNREAGDLRRHLAHYDVIVMWIKVDRKESTDAVHFGSFCVFCFKQELLYVPHCHLNYWGRVTHICVSKLTISGSDNGLSLGRHQADTGMLWLIGSLETNFSVI